MIDFSLNRVDEKSFYRSRQGSSGRAQRPCRRDGTYRRSVHQRYRLHGWPNSVAGQHQIHTGALADNDRTGGDRMITTTIPILRYHSVSTDPAPWIAPYAVAPATFSRHVDLIAASGRTAMTVSELCAALTGHTPLPHRPIAITFDDGFADFTYAARVLSEHYLPATVYLTTGALRGRGPRPTNMAMPSAPMLDWSQLADLYALNVEIGAQGTPIANWTHCRPVRSPTRSSNPRKCWRTRWGAKCRALHTPSVSIARRRAVSSSRWAAALRVRG